MKTWKGKENFEDNHGQNILRLVDVWASFPFSTGETKHNY